MRPMGASTCASPSSAPASPAWAAPGCCTRQGHAVTLFEANDYLGGHTAHGRRHAGRRHRAGGHRLPGLQRPHLSEPHRAVRRAGRGERRRREMSFSVRVDGAGSSGRAPTSPALFAQPRNALRPGVLADARRHRALQPRRRPRCSRDGTVPVGDARRVPRQRSATAAPFRDWYLLPMAAAIWSCADARHARLPAADLRALLPQPRPAADRPTGRSGGPCAAARANTSRRIAARLPDVRVATPVQRRPAPRRRGVEVDAGGPRRALRRGRARLPQRPGARAAGRPVAARRRGCWRRSATSPTASCCTPTPRCCRASRRAWSAWNYLAGRRRRRRRGRSRSATSSTGCSRCRSRRR